MIIPQLDEVDIKWVKETPYLYGLAWEEDEKQWTTTSHQLSLDGTHFHGQGATVAAAILDMNQQIAKWLRTPIVPKPLKKKK